MKYAFAGAALVASAFAVPAWGPGTETVEVTTLETITSCGPEVTNCPAKSSEAWSKPTGGWTDSWSDSWATSTSSSSVASSTSTSVVTSPATSSAPVTTWYTSTSTTPISPVFPSSSSTTTPVAPVSVSSSSTLTWTHPVGPTGSVPTGGYAHGSSSCGPGHPGWPGYSGTAPVSGGIKPTGSGTGVWSYPTSSSSPITPSTGGAAQNAAGVLAGLGAIAAFFL